MRNKRKLEKAIDFSLMGFKEGEMTGNRFSYLVKAYITRYGTNDLIDEQVREYEQEIRRRGNE